MPEIMFQNRWSSGNCEDVDAPLFNRLNESPDTRHTRQKISSSSVIFYM